MRKHAFFDKKKPAQAMVEFAIALPILLLLLYGIIETGRLLFLVGRLSVTVPQQVMVEAAIRSMALHAQPFRAIRIVQVFAPRQMLLDTSPEMALIRFNLLMIVARKIHQQLHFAPQALRMKFQALLQ
jgi:hypothetical protein